MNFNMQWRVVGFGFLMSLSSSFGQTHFISLFNAQLRDAFELNHASIGALYSAATLCSAVLLAWLGRQLDYRDLRLYTASVIVGLACAAITLSVANSLTLLFIAFFLLRLFGQGLSSHISITVTAKLSTHSRGKALSFASLGHGAGEGIAPLLIGALIVSYSWRQIWIGAAIIELIVVMALAMWLLQGLNCQPQCQDTKQQTDNTFSWSRRQVLRDPRFWRIAPALLAPSFFVTSLLFHQYNLATHKGVDFRFWTAGFVAYSASQVVITIVAGHLIDKYGSAKILKLALPFMAVALLLPMWLDFSLLPFVYYGLIGVCVGISTPAATALWRDLYGSAHLGANLAMSQALLVLASAIGPVLFGLLLDATLPWPVILGGSATLILVFHLSLVYTKLDNAVPPETIARLG